MGLSGAVKKLLRERALDAFVQECETRRPGRTSSNVHVDLLDYLTRFVAIKDRDTKLFTHDELFAHFWAHPQHSSSQLCITICDDRARVTRAKDETHVVRAVQAAKADAKKGVEPAKPYPADAAFWSGGVTYKEEEDGELVHEPICLRRLRKSRNPKACNLGNTLWQSFVPCIQRAMATASRQFILDVDRDAGPLGFEPKSTDAPVPIEPKHEVGEADPAMLFWTKQMEDQEQADDIHWYSNDSDLISLYLLYHDRRTAAQRANIKIWWHCENGIAVDMARMADLMVQHTPGCVSAAALGVAFILPGSDFVDQGAYAFGFGPLKIIEAFLRLGEGAAEAAMRPDPNPNPDPDQSIFKKFLIDLYNYKRTQSVAPLLRKHLAPLEFAELRTQHPRFPTDDVFKRQEQRFYDNVIYWYMAPTGKQPRHTPAVAAAASPAPPSSAPVAATVSRKRKRDDDHTEAAQQPPAKKAVA